MRRGQARRMSCASLVPGTSSLALAVGSGWANVVGISRLLRDNDARLTASASLPQPSPAPIVRCRIAASPRRRSPTCSRRPYRSAAPDPLGQTPHSARDVPSPSRRPCFGWTACLVCVLGTVFLYSSSLLASTICRSPSLQRH